MKSQFLFASAISAMMLIACGGDSGSNAKNDSEGESQGSPSSAKQTCTESDGCDAMDKSDVSTWHFVREDSFGEDAEYTYSVSGRDLIVAIKDANGTTSLDTFSFYNMESEVGVEYAFSAAKSTCEDGNGKAIVCEASSSSAEDVSSSSVEKFGTMTDARDGKTYKTVTIGDQTWMAENLNYVYDQLTAGGYESNGCYENEPDSCAKYGRLYRWSAALDSAAVFSEDCKGCGYYESGYSLISLAANNSFRTVRGICPEGWHMPSINEWQTLITFVGGKDSADTKLKAADGWDGTDDFGFSMLPGGFAPEISGDGYFQFAGHNAYFWTTEEDPSSQSAHFGSTGRYAKDIFVGVGDSWVATPSTSKTEALSVRCVKDSI